MFLRFKAQENLTNKRSKRVFKAPITNRVIFPVPIIPDYLFFNDINASIPESPSERLGPASLSPLQRKYETLERDNGPMGALLASKAFVQLAVTPLVGYAAAAFGCNVPLFFGSCNMLLACVRK